MIQITCSCWPHNFLKSCIKVQKHITIYVDMNIPKYNNNDMRNIFCLGKTFYKLCFDFCFLYISCGLSKKNIHLKKS